jgi:hypothetical protein
MNIWVSIKTSHKPINPAILKGLVNLPIWPFEMHLEIEVVLMRPDSTL